jgi:hypothetical protein
MLATSEATRRLYFVSLFGITLHIFKISNHRIVLDLGRDIVSGERDGGAGVRRPRPSFVIESDSGLTCPFKFGYCFS